MINKFKRIVPYLILAIVIFLCGDTAMSNRAEAEAETEKLQPVDVFIQGVGLDIRRVAFNSDDSHIITSGNGTTVWDLNAKKELKTVFKTEAHSMAVSNSGRYSITYSPVDQGKINICDFSNSTIRSLQIISKKDVSFGVRYITGFSITDDEKRFVLETGSKIKVFDIETLKQLNEIELKKSHYLFSYRKKGLSFIPGTNDLLSISYDINISEPDVLEEERENQFLINTYDIDGKEPKFSYSFKSKFIYSWAISGDGKKLALLFMDKQIQIISLINGGKSNHKIEIDDEVTVIGFKDDKNLTFAGRAGVIGTYDIEKNQTRIVETAVRGIFDASSCIDLAISNSGNTIAFCNGYNKLTVYNMLSNEITTLGDPSNSILGDYYGSDASLNILTPQMAYKQNGSHFDAQEFKINKLVSVFADQFRIENTKTGISEIFDSSVAKTIYSVKLEDEDKSYAAFTQDGKFAFYWKKTENSNNQLSVINLEDVNSNPVRLVNSNNYGHNIKVFDYNKKAIISGPAHEDLGIWDIQTGKLLSKLNEQSGLAGAFEFIDENKCLIGTGNGDVKLYDLSNGKILKIYTPVKGDLAYQDIEKIAFSKDKKYFATGGSRGLVTIWDFNKEHDVISFETHKNGITSLGFSPDGKYIVSGSNNGKSVVISKISTGKGLAKFVSFADGEWIVITPEGYYNASPNGDKYLNVRFGNNVYGIENYREAFFRPDLVKLALSGGSLQGYRTLADVKQPPKVAIVQTAISSPTEDFKLTLRLEEQGGGIGDVRLFLNGSAVMLDSGRGLKVVRKEEKGVTYRSYTLKLSPGNNTIRAIAFNAGNSMQSNDTTHQVTASFTSTRKPTLHALVIGIQEFRNPKLTLKYTVADANLFAETLRKGATGLFEQVHITTLTAREATTRDDVISALQRFKAINPDDLFILYIASHGTVDEGEYFLITSNVGSLRTEKLKTDAISQNMLKEAIANIPATKKLIIIDTCSAGALGDAIQVAVLTRGMSEDTALKILSRSVGSTILSASTSVQEALEGYNGHGLFTYVLAEGLKGKADKGKTGYIKTTELADYVDSEVPVLAEKVFKRAQYPTISISGQAFPIGKVR